MAILWRKGNQLIVQQVFEFKIKSTYDKDNEHKWIFLCRWAYITFLTKYLMKFSTDIYCKIAKLNKKYIQYRVKYVGLDIRLILNKIGKEMF